MRNINGIVLLAFCLAALIACSETRPMVYSSTASLHRAVSNTTTVMRLHDCGAGKPSAVRFAAISALDSLPGSKPQPYVLLAPLKSPDASRFLISNYALHRGTSLQMNDADALVAHLRNVRSSWSDQIKAGGGTFSEFLVVPSGRQIRTSDSVVAYYPSLEVYGSRVDGAHALELRLKEGRTWLTYVIDDQDELDCVIAMMENAIRGVRDL